MSGVTELVGIRTAYALTGIGESLRLLVEAHLIDAYTAAGKLYLHPDTVAELQSRPVLHPEQVEHPAVVVRCQPASEVPDDPTRSHTGWDAHLGPEVRRAGIDRWWRLRADITGQYFVATVAGIIVASGRITGTSNSPVGPGLQRVHAVWDDTAEYIPGRRLATGRGGPVINLAGRQRH